MKIRKAQPEEAEALSKIAVAAKRHWGYPDHWIEYWREDLTIVPDYIFKNDVFVAEETAELVGFYALVLKNEKAELDHLWVAPEHLGRGVGKELFVHAMQRASAHKLSEVEIYSDPNAEGFYSKMGATKEGELDSEIDGQQRSIPRLKIDPRNS